MTWNENEFDAPDIYHWEVTSCTTVYGSMPRYEDWAIWSCNKKFFLMEDLHIVILLNILIFLGALTTWCLWTGGYTRWEATTAAPVLTQSRSTTRGATSGLRPPACSLGAAASAWRYSSSWTSRRLPRPPSQCPPPAFDTGSPFGWLRPPLLQPRLDLGRDATVQCEMRRGDYWERRGEGELKARRVNETSLFGTVHSRIISKLG